MQTRFQLPQKKTFCVFLELGHTAYVEVCAKRAWNDSGIDVVAGQSYSFSVPGSEMWQDWWQRCRADGYSDRNFLKPLRRFRRAPAGKWMQLVGTIGRQRRFSILIGSHLIDFFPPFPGRLYFFANDLPWMGWQNRGMIALRITRTK
jgi:hypothetical protein